MHPYSALDLTAALPRLVFVSGALSLLDQNAFNACDVKLTIKVNLFNRADAKQFRLSL
jgi:hypothetical protein